MYAESNKRDKYLEVYSGPTDPKEIIIWLSIESKSLKIPMKKPNEEIKEEV